MFRTGLLSIIKSIVLYTQQWVFVIHFMLSAGRSGWNCRCLFNNNNNNNNNIYFLQLGCYPVAVVILHVNKHEIGYY